MEKLQWWQVMFLVIFNKWREVLHLKTKVILVMEDTEKKVLCNGSSNIFLI